MPEGCMEVREKDWDIVLQNVSMQFGEKKVLKEVSLHIERGEIFGLLGPSGAGKTTLIKILTGQAARTGGSACLWGRDCGQLGREAYRKIGMMLDNTGLYERLSCYDNLKLFAQIYGIPMEKAEDGLQEVGLWQDRKQTVGKLSKGMRGRLALVRAVMHEPQLLFLDEPTSGLDPATSVWIHKLIKKQQGQGTTVFLTTHNMEEAAKLCSHVALLSDGTIVEYGKPEEICRRHDRERQIRILLKDGERVLMRNESTQAEMLKDYMAHGMIETIHSLEPDLETVFLQLTGKEWK